MTRWFKTLALPLLLVACGPEDPTGEELVEIVAACAEPVCQDLPPTETTTCLLERIEAGEPGYATFPIDSACAEGPSGTYHLLVRDSATFSYILDITYTGGDAELYNPYEMYEIEVDPQRLTATLENCSEQSENACPPCVSVLDVGDRTPLQTITCDDAQ